MTDINAQLNEYEFRSFFNQIHDIDEYVEHILKNELHLLGGFKELLKEAQKADARSERLKELVQVMLDEDERQQHIAVQLDAVYRKFSAAMVKLRKQYPKMVVVDEAKGKTFLRIIETVYGYGGEVNDAIMALEHESQDEHQIIMKFREGLGDHAGDIAHMIHLIEQEIHECKLALTRLGKHEHTMRELDKKRHKVLAHHLAQLR